MQVIIARHQTGRAQVEDTLQRVPTSVARDESSTSSAEIIFCSSGGTFTPHALPSLQIEGGALASTRHLRSQSPMSVRAHRTEGVTEPEGREDANGVGGAIGVGGGNGDRNRVGGRSDDMNGGGGAKQERERERQRGRGRGWGPGDDHVMGTGMEAGTEMRAVSEMRMETMIGTGTRAGTETRAIAETGMGTRMGTGTRIASERAEERRISVRIDTRLVDAMWETGKI